MGQRAQEGQLAGLGNETGRARDAARGAAAGGASDRIVTGEWEGWTGSRWLLHDRRGEGAHGQLSSVATARQAEPRLGTE